MSFPSATDALTQALQQLTDSDRVNAKTFRNAILKTLTDMGCCVRSEVLVANRGDNHRGKVDLVVDTPFQAAIELDNVLPRYKSIFKLRQFQCERFVLLRQNPQVVLIV